MGPLRNLGEGHKHQCSEFNAFLHLKSRHAGESHNDAAALLKTIDSDDEGVKTNANRVVRILSVKNFAEYEDRLISRSEAEKVVINCEKFLEYVKTKLPK